MHLSPPGIKELKTSVDLDMALGAVLLVEDDDEVRQVVELLLEPYVTNIVSVNSARAALGQLQNTPEAFDMLITDHEMPKMKGLELIQHLRNTGIPLPALVMSGNMQQFSPDSLGLSDLAVLGKPFSEDELMNEIHSLVSVYQAHK